jgi:hypothetical protein
VLINEITVGEGESESNETINKIIDRTITSIMNMSVSSIGSYAFAECSLLSTASFPNCKII